MWHTALLKTKMPTSKLAKAIKPKAATYITDEGAGDYGAVIAVN